MISLPRSRLVKDRSSPQQAIDKKADVPMSSQKCMSAKMEAVGRVCGRIAHDMNNYLTAITGYTQILALSLEDIDKTLHTQAGEVLKAAEMARGLTQQLNALKPQPPRSARTLNLNEVVAGARDFIEQTCGQGIQVAYDLSPEPLAVLIDSSQAMQAILNLARNSAEAMTDGGRLWLRTQSVDLDEALAEELCLAGPGRFAQLTLEDTGPGLPPQIAERLFEPLNTTKPKGTIVGMGLAITYGLVMQNHGAMQFRTGQGKGATVDLYFPLA